MVKQTIQIFLRFRPTDPKLSISKYELDDITGEKPKVTFQLDHASKDHTIYNRKDLYRFQFDDIFDVVSGQDQIFDSVAKPVVDKVLDGYNGTVFAYGQTGSGKTFTITGGAEKYSDRGIIPRTIVYIFNHFEKRLDTEFAMRISYLEIYNENGYDLLDAKHTSTRKLEELPRVTLFEDTDAGTVHLKNLSIHSATNIDEALNLLFMGDTNRMIAETPMNEASTRSHCIFTMHIMAKRNGSSKLRRSKLHLVDLAGSERVHKSGIEGSTLTEAKYINLSLHYLEQVIIALADKQRTHVPYRNSMMTMVLRDSLGGNCLTSMVATCSVEQSNIQETISTCRFAQRVALIKNDVILNEEMDPRQIITKLKQEIERLKAELALATGTEHEEDLSDEEKERCQAIITNFLSGESKETQSGLPAQIFSDIRKIYYCFSVIRKTHSEMLTRAKNAVHVIPTPTLPPIPVTTKEAGQLREIVAQRDHEIQILVDLLKREKQKKTSDLVHGNDTNRTKGREIPLVETGHGCERVSVNGSLETITAAEQVSNWLEQQVKGRLLGSMSLGRAEAFEMFKSDYKARMQIDRQKDELRSHYAEAKALGKRMKEARDEAGVLQSQLASLLQAQGDHTDTALSSRQSDEIENVRCRLEQKRVEYCQIYEALKELRPKVEHLQYILEKAKVQLVRDFEEWWSGQCAQHGCETAENGLRPEAGRNTEEVKPIPLANQILHRKEKEMMLASNDSAKESDNYNFKRKQSLGSGLSTDMDTLSQSRAEAVPLTGDPVVDADILTFIRAREKIRLRQQQQIRSRRQEQ